MKKILSREAIARLKLGHLPMWRVGLRAGFTPSVFYRITSGIQLVHTDDHRLKKLAAILGLPIEELVSSATEGN